MIPRHKLKRSILNFIKSFKELKYINSSVNFMGTTKKCLSELQENTNIQPNGMLKTIKDLK